jgi:hypothetical protein
LQFIDNENSTLTNNTIFRFLKTKLQIFNIAIDKPFNEIHFFLKRELEIYMIGDYYYLAPYLCPLCPSAVSHVLLLAS